MNEKYGREKKTHKIHSLLTLLVSSTFYNRIDWINSVEIYLFSLIRFIFFLLFFELKEKYGKIEKYGWRQKEFFFYFFHFSLKENNTLNTSRGNVIKTNIYVRTEKKFNKQFNQTLFKIESIKSNKQKQWQ